MVEFVIFWVVLLFLALIGWWAWYNHHKQAAAWNALAARTGLTLDIESNWFATQLRLHGSLNDVEVLVRTEVRGSGKSAKTFTVFTAELGPYIPRQMEIYHQGFGSSVGKLFGAQDIEIGNPNVDKRFIIRSTPESRARDFFKEPSVQRALVSLHEYCPSIRLDDTTLHLEFLGAGRDEEKLFAHLTRLTRAAQTIREAYPPPVVSPVVASAPSGMW